MFDIGFWELILLSGIGLLVLGPERLPRVARTIGNWVREARTVVRKLQQEVEREVAIDDVKRRYDAEQILDPKPPPPPGARDLRADEAKPDE